ncbi:uncharacterized protein [Engystomops pustulosus]|uniref:uncharacterized protein n=1 Tax=Engystomops pustulosus TaxID=76066 RepID=UPI003AFA91E1
MESKELRSRRKTQETWTQSFPHEEVLKFCSKSNEKITDVDNLDLTLAKNTRIGIQKATLKRDRRFPKTKLLLPSSETALIRREAITIGSFCNSLNSLKLTESKNIDNFQKKRPIRLAPLELPVQVKEAQMEKITTMAEGVGERKPPHQRLNTPYQCPTKNQPLKKIGKEENKLPRLPEDILATKDNVLFKESSVRTSSLPRDLHGGGLKLSVIRPESTNMKDSLPKNISSKVNESGDVSVEGHLRSTRCPKASHGAPQTITISGPPGDYTEMRAIGK